MNRLLIAALVVAGLLVAVWLVVPSRTARTTEVSAPPSPLTKIDADEVTKLVLRHRVGQGEDRTAQTVELVRGPAGDDGEPVWRLAAPVEDEANQGAVKTLLKRLGELELRDVASEMAASHRDLEVDDEGGIGVEVFAGGSRLASFVVGKYLGGRTMVRMDGSDIVWRTSGSLRYVFGKPAADWRNKGIFELERDEVTRLELRSAGGHFVFERQAATEGESEASWIATTVDAPAPPPDEDAEEETPAKTKRPPAPSGRLSRIDELDPAKVRSLATTLARLRCTDFVDSTEGLETGLEAEDAARVTFRVGEGEDATEHTLLLGAEHDTRSVYARRGDRGQVYLVTKSLAERLRPDVRAFQKRASTATKASAAALGDEGGGLPPDVLKAAQQEIQRQALLKQLADQAGRQ